MKRSIYIIAMALVTIAAFYPIFFGKIPLNSRNLVAFFTPWYYEKFAGFPIGVPSKPGMLDQIRLYYPYMRLTQQSYQMGQLPLWNPYNFAGNPHMAEWQSGVFYPLHVLLPLLPLPVYWSLFQMTGFFLAGLFTYLFLRNLRLSELASVFGGLTYMLSSFMTTWNMEVVVTSHSILWLPLLLLAVDHLVVRLTDKGKRTKGDRLRWWLVGLAGLVLSILSGYWQTTLYVMIVTAIYAIYRLMTRKRFPPFHISLLILLWFPLAITLTAFHLLPTWELYQRSSRPIVNALPSIQQVLIDYLLPVRHLVTLFVPDYFGHPTTRNYFANVGGGTYYEHVLFVGTIQFFFAVLAITFRKIRAGDVWFWFLVSAVAASFSFDTPWARLVYSLRIPVLSTGIANRILFVQAFGTAMLASFGLETVWRFASRRMLVRVSATALVAVSILLLATLIGRSGLGAFEAKADPTLYLTSLRNMVIPTGVLLAGIGGLLIGVRWQQKHFLLILFLVVFTSTAQNLYQHHKFTAFSEMQFTYPSHPTIDWLRRNAGINRFLGYNGQYLNNNFSTQYGIYSIEGYDSLNDYKRSQLVHSAEKGTLPLELPRSADAILSQNFNNPRMLRLMQLFGIRFLVDHPEWIDVGPTAGLPRLPEEKQQLVFESGDWRIWDYLDALPRSFLVGEYEVVSDGQSTIDRLYAEDFDPGRRVLLLAQPTGEFHIRPDVSSKVAVDIYTPNTITFKTSSKTDQLLFLSDTWYPGWKAKLETGKILPVLTADYALRAVPVPAGNHTITMWYFPESFSSGLLVAAISVLLTTVFAIGIGSRMSLS